MEYFNETIFFFFYIKVSKIFEGNNFLLRTKGNSNFLFILFLFYSATNENSPRILKTKILTDEIKLQSTLLRNQYKIHNSLFRNEILIDKLFRIMIPISIHQRKIKIYPTNLSNKFGRKPQRGQAAWNRPQSNNSQSFGSIRRTRAFKAAKDKLTVGRRCRSTKLPGWKYNVYRVRENVTRLDSRFAHTLRPVLVENRTRSSERWWATIVAVRFTAYFLRLWETRGMQTLE